MPSMVTGDHDFEAELSRAAREQAELDQQVRPSPFATSERANWGHGRQWLPDWQYGALWRFVPRPKDGSKPEFEAFGPDGLPGDGWELNVDAGEGGIETSTPAQPDVLMQMTYWRRWHPGLDSSSPRHHVSARFE